MGYNVLDTPNVGSLGGYVAWADRIRSNQQPPPSDMGVVYNNASIDVYDENSALQFHAGPDGVTINKDLELDGKLIGSDALAGRGIAVVAKRQFSSQFHFGADSDSHTTDSSGYDYWHAKDFLTGDLSPDLIGMVPYIDSYGHKISDWPTMYWSCLSGTITLPSNVTIPQYFELDIMPSGKYARSGGYFLNQNDMNRMIGYGYSVIPFSFTDNGYLDLYGSTSFGGGEELTTVDFSLRLTSGQRVPLQINYSYEMVCLIGASGGNLIGPNITATSNSSSSSSF